MHAQHPSIDLRSILPARLGYARDEPLGRQLTKCETRHLEAAVKRAAAPRHFATVHYTRWAGIARQLRETGVILFRFQLGAQRGVLFYRCAFAFIPINPGGLGHKRTLTVEMMPRLATWFWGLAKSRPTRSHAKCLGSPVLSRTSTGWSYPKVPARLFCFTSAAVERPLERAELRFCLTD